jgi:hypothetical protein
VEGARAVVDFLMVLVGTVGGGERTLWSRGGYCLAPMKMEMRMRMRMRMWMKMDHGGFGERGPCTRSKLFALLHSAESTTNCV